MRVRIPLYPSTVALPAVPVFPFTLSQCNFPFASFSPQRPCFRRLLRSPQHFARCANHLFSDTSGTTLVRPRSYLNPHHGGGFLCSFTRSSITLSSLAAWAFTMTSITGLVIPGGDHCPFWLTSATICQKSGSVNNTTRYS
jgi:hypothetical protein